MSLEKLRNPVLFQTEFGQCVIVRSPVLSQKMGSDRFIVCDVKNVDIILSDANGVGFRSVEKAKNAVITGRASFFTPSKSNLPVITRTPKQDKAAHDAIKQRMQEMMRFKLPPYEEIEPLAEYVCRTLFNEGEIYGAIPEGYTAIADYFNTVKDGHLAFTEFDDIRLYPLDNEYLTALMDFVEKHPKPVYSEYPFLNFLFTGYYEFGDTEKERYYDTYMQKYIHKLLEEFRIHYPVVFSPLCETDYENAYCDEHPELFTADIMKKNREVLEGFSELLMQFIHKQDWHRFIPVLTAIAEKNEHPAPRDVLEAARKAGDGDVIQAVFNGFS